MSTQAYLELDRLVWLKGDAPRYTALGPAVVVEVRVDGSFLDEGGTCGAPDPLVLGSR